MNLSEYFDFDERTEFNDDEQFEDAKLARRRINVGPFALANTKIQDRKIPMFSPQTQIRMLLVALIAIPFAAAKANAQTPQG